MSKRVLHHNSPSHSEGSFKMIAKRFLLNLWLFFLLFLVVLLVVVNFKMDNKRKLVSSELFSLEAELDQLVGQGKTDYSSRQLYLEEVAREDLNFRKEGETVVAFPVSDNVGRPQGPSSDIITNQSLNNNRIKSEEQMSFWKELDIFKPKRVKREGDGL